jgi:hypothetical protein
MAAPRRPKITAEVKAKLLGRVRAGYDVEAACSQVGLSPKVVQQDAALMAEVNEAYRIATAKLRAKLMDVALKGDDARILAQLLEKRDEAQLKMAPPKEVSSKQSREALLETIAAVFERQILNDPPKWLGTILGSVLGDSPIKLNAEARAAAERLLEVLACHPSLPYSPEWWVEERRRGGNGFHGAAGIGGWNGANVVAGNERPAPRPTDAPARPEKRVKRPDDLGTLNPTEPLPPSQSLVSRGSAGRSRSWCGSGSASSS